MAGAFARMALRDRGTPPAKNADVAEPVDATDLKLIPHTILIKLFLANTMTY